MKIIQPTQFTQILKNLVLAQQRSKMWNTTESLTLKKLTENCMYVNQRNGIGVTFVTENVKYSIVMVLMFCQQIHK